MDGGAQLFPIETEADIVSVRRHAKLLAEECGFDAFATAALTTAASELARNVWTHARKGTAELSGVIEDGRHGIRMIFRDEGPGIPDLERALGGGFSTARSLGLGLSGSRRLVDEFDVKSEVGKGTIVTVVKWSRRS